MAASYLSVLRRRWRLIVALTLVVGGLFAAALTGGADTYTSTAVLQTRGQQVAEAVLGQSSGYVEPEQRLASELETVQSQAVQDRALARLQADGRLVTEDELDSKLRVSARGISTFLEVSATDTDPAAARDLVAAVITAYAEYEQELTRGELQRVSDDLEVRLAAAEAEIDTLDASADTSGQAGRQRAAALTRYESLAELLERVRLRLSLDTGSVVVTSPPSLPVEADALVPTPVAFALAVLGGLLTAVGTAILVDIVRDPVRTRAEAQRLVGREPAGELVLTRDALSPAWVSDLTGADHPSAAAARSLRLRLDAAGGGQLPLPVEVRAEADRATEGVAVAVALAAAYGHAGMRTLLVLEPAPLQALRAPDAPAAPSGAAGLVSVPARLPGVALLPSVTTDRGERGLLDTPSPAAALQQLASEHDAVVLSSPASGDGLDVPQLQAVGGTRLTVCVLGRTSATWFQRTVEASEADAELSATVLVDRRRQRSAPRRAAGRRDQGSGPAGAAAAAAPPAGQAGPALSPVVPVGAGDGAVEGRHTAEAPVAAAPATAGASVAGSPLATGSSAVGGPGHRPATSGTRWFRSSGSPSKGEPSGPSGPPSQA